MATTIVLASHNNGKLREFAQLLAPLGLKIEAAASLGLGEVEETAQTFQGNAELKARAAANVCGKIALADDSGLCVDALNGAPGIYSARWAEQGAEQINAAGINKRDFHAACLRVQDELQKKINNNPSNNPSSNFTARFVCALCLAQPNARTQHWIGKVEGQLSFPPRGKNGFGYDPIFIPNGESMTFAEMNPAKKTAISHRAIAVNAFAEWLQSGEWQNQARNQK
ncbi:MAG: RdgB/HAM1 family non-canonical purine NTP pyrophosphatase [Alphaproteobacteria bacterium]